MTCCPAFAGAIAAMPSGPSDHDIIDAFASNPDHWVSVRKSGIHVGVAEMWNLHGTCKRWPVLIDQGCLTLRGVAFK